jgi:hypothetical protein
MQNESSRLHARQRGRHWPVSILAAIGALGLWPPGCSASDGSAVGASGGRGDRTGAPWGGTAGAGFDFPSAEGGAAGTTGEASTPPRCVPTGEDEPDDHFEDTNCDGIDGDVARALFVAVDGDDSAVGTLEAPLATLQAAIDRSKSEQKHVYVCNGAYEQAVTIQGSGIRLYGGFDCEDGGRRIADRARIESKRAIPLRVAAARDVIVDRLAFVAPDATGLEESSVAAVVEKSVQVQLRRVELESGEAGPGRPGEAGAAISGRSPNGAPGGHACLQLLCDAYGDGGYSAAAPLCEGGGRPEIGGAGGDGGRPGRAAEPGAPSPSGVAGGRVSDAVLAERDGEAGAIGRRGPVGDGPEGSIGDLAGSRYLATNAGRPGGYGSSGEAGGGGAGLGELWEGDLCCAPGHGGSQGGFGGCGGRPGLGGTGGGASIALVLVESEVALVWTRLIAGDGGAGGAGGPGGSGQAGGMPGEVYSFRGQRFAGIGGPGGEGGPGGAGGPGGGGPSLGVALLDSPFPELDGVQVLLGLPGFGGAAADAVSGVDGPDGVALSGYDFTNHEELTF